VKKEEKEPEKEKPRRAGKNGKTCCEKRGSEEGNERGRGQEDGRKRYRSGRGC
jgi:hypothetical protein